jgi:hypothetical protein
MARVLENAHMPPLPLDHALPLIATFGVMLYPGTDREDRQRAAAYAAHVRNRACRQFLNDGGTPTPTIDEGLAEDAELPPDLKRRWRAGLATGNVLKALFGVCQTNAIGLGFPVRAICQEARRARHSARAASRLVLKFCRL